MRGRESLCFDYLGYGSVQEVYGCVSMVCVSVLRDLLCECVSVSVCLSLGTSALALSCSLVDLGSSLVGGWTLQYWVVLGFGSSLFPAWEINACPPN